MKKLIILTLAAVLVLGLTSVPAVAATDYSFNYTITATGTEDVLTYPDQEFTWTLDYDCGDYTWWICGEECQEIWQNINGIWTMTGLDCTAIFCDNLVIHHWPPGSGVVNATEGDKLIFRKINDWWIDSWISADNPNVTIWTEIGMIPVPGIIGELPYWFDVYASTDYSEIVTQPWTASESGSASVSDAGGDTYITTSTLAAPNGDTVWTVTDDNPDVHTWMVGNQLYASVSPPPPSADLQAVEYRWGSPAPGYAWDPFPTTFRSWMEVRFENQGEGDAFNVTASIMDAPANVTIVDGDVTLGNIAAGATAWSADIYTIELDMTNPQNPDEGIFWRVEYDDAAGIHHAIENVPQFPAGD